jgi:hypothetical protein
MLARRAMRAAAPAFRVAGGSRDHVTADDPGAHRIVMAHGVNHGIGLRCGPFDHMHLKRAGWA